MYKTWSVILLIVVPCFLFGQVSTAIQELLQKGDSLLYIKQHDEARELYESAKNLAENNSFTSSKFLAEYKTGYSYLREESDFLAMAYFTDIQLNFTPETKKDSALLFLTNLEIDIASHATIHPEYPTNQTLQLAKQNSSILESHEGFRLKSLIVLLYSSRSNYSATLDSFRSLLISDKNLDPWLESELMDHIIYLCFWKQDYQMAIAFAEQILSGNNNYFEHFFAKEMIARSYFRKRVDDIAISKNLKLILDYSENAEFMHYILMAYIRIGMCYHRKSDLEKAVEYYMVAESFCPITNESALAFSFLYQVWSKVYRDIGQFEKAVSLLRKASEIQREYDIGRYQEMQIAEILGRNYRYWGKYEEAISVYDKIISIISKEEYNSFEGDHLYRYANLLRSKYFTSRIYWESNKDKVDLLKESHQGFKYVLNIFQEQYEGMKNDKSRLNVIYQIRLDYENLFLTSICLYEVTGKKEYLEEAYNYLEKGKGLLLKDEINYEQAKLDLSIPGSLLEKEKLYKNYVDGIKFLLNEKNLSVQEINKLKRELPSAILKYDSIKTALGAVNENNLRDASKAQTYNFKNIQSRINRNQVVLDYFITEGRLFAFAFTKDTTLFQEIDFEGDIKSKLLAYKKNIESSNMTDDYRSTIRDFKLKSYELNCILIEPFKEIIEKREVLIVPDKEIGLIAIESLITDTIGSNFSELNYLVKSNVISELYSIDQLLKESESISTNSKRIGFAPIYASYKESVIEELPWAECEIKAASDYFRGRQYIKNQAVKERFINEAGKYEIVHLALHTRINNETPSHSQLLFSEEHEPLTLFEIYGLPFETKLMVLSGCSTGEGEIFWGEGVMSLSRSFLVAGIENLVITKWQVSDQSSAKIIKYFFEAMSKGEAVNRAMNIAKCRYLVNEDPLYHHPKYWAGHIILGKPLKVNISYKKYILSVFLVLIFSITLFIKNKKTKRG